MSESEKALYARLTRELGTLRQSLNASLARERVGIVRNASRSIGNEFKLRRIEQRQMQVVEMLTSLLLYLRSGKEFDQRRFDMIAAMVAKERSQKRRLRLVKS